MLVMDLKWGLGEQGWSRTTYIYLWVIHGLLVLYMHRSETGRSGGGVALYYDIMC